MQNSKSTVLFFTYIICVTSLSAQPGDTTDYYYEIPDYQEEYNAGTVAARVVDGLGFRYYWGTEGLNDSDLKYRPSEGARNIEETIDHILVLTEILAAAVNEEVFEGVEIEGLSYEEKRDRTLENIKRASIQLKSSNHDDLDRYDIKFSNGTQFPFWNLLNGPIADAINHVGQIISFRRTNGNPYNQNISVLQGRVRG